ncbi:ribulokinase [Bacillus sp. E(2018)]|uniref:ribulokinase n=1 Tax=Bacillus sp. E(2018) TaxID=2502239 RepID=UPI0010F49563|nr:ribulokinase [Bacillus sp. E(2018)]
MSGYSIGIDFGTESGRVLVVEVNTGTIKAVSTVPYKHGVMVDVLPTDQSVQIPPDFALQHPQDYLDVLYHGIPAVMKEANIQHQEVKGIGIDFTSSTFICVDENLDPICSLKEYENNPHAWVKLWKHHGPKEEAQALLDKALSEKSEWLRKYGFTVSTEWFIPKCLETINHAPDVYEATDYMLEAGDWIVAKLTGEVVRSNCSLGFKAFWSEEEGFPQKFFEELNPSLGQMVHTKLQGKIGKVGQRAGGLTEEMANSLGLPQGLPVGVSIIDAHSALLGVGASNSNQLTMVMGTSTCHMTLNEEFIQVPGISGVVKDGILPGFYAYEAGQSAVGDLFGWYVKQAPASYLEEAKKQNLSLFTYLEALANQKEPGETGLIALDWHNGNRSVLSDSNLTGTLIGLTLQTKPEDIYRAYLEATAFGSKIIIDNFESWGIAIDRVYACGGLPQKNELLMQIYADGLNREIHVSSTDHASGIGAAMLGAAAGGMELEEVVQSMKQPFLKTYYPKPKHVEKYEALFELYKEIHDEFGYKRPHVMKRLKQLTLK